MKRLSRVSAVVDGFGTFSESIALVVCGVFSGDAKLVSVSTFLHPFSDPDLAVIVLI
jgi:hypothetical protein